MPRSSTRPLALVTGAAKGIGLAIAQKLIRQGFRVLAVDVDQKGLKQLALSHPTLIQTFRCDVGQPRAVKTLCKKILKTEGTPWALINNAGWGGPFHKIDEVTDEEWTRIFDINVRSVFTFSREILPAMAQIGTGRIVNIASIQGHYGAERSSTYAASKHAVIGYTRSIAVEWAPHGITCNAVCPGYIDTHQGARDDHSQNFLARVAARTPVGRTAGPDEVADLVAWMIGTPSKRPNSSYLNGSIITLDGGITAGLGL